MNCEAKLVPRLRRIPRKVRAISAKIIYDKKSTHSTLKEQCHEDFAVLGQLCANIITLRL